MTLLREAMEQRRTARFRVYGDSMLPTLWDGAQVELRPLSRPPRRGEIVALVIEGALRVHRVRRLETDGNVVTQGDAALHPDLPTRPADVLGRVELRRPLRSRLRRGLRRLLRAASSLRSRA